MKLRPAAVPSVDPAPANVGAELLDQEQAALDSERLLAAEAAAQSREIAELTVRTEQLAARAEQLRADGVAAAEWLLARIQAHRLQPPDLSAPLAQAHAARAEALTARARAVEASRVLLRATASALSEHRAALARDETELVKAQATAEAQRLEAERRAAEAQAEAERRATAEAAPRILEEPRKSGAQALGRLTPPRPEPSGRVGTRVPLQVAVDLTSDSNLFTGFSTNISEGGLFVATVNMLPVGTLVDLTLNLPGQSKLSIQGEVRWLREVNDRTPNVFPGFGVRFLNLFPPTAEALKRFVAEREPLFYPD